MRSSSLFSGFGASALLLLSASPVSADCICRFNGGEVTHGHTACLVTAKGRELARCEKSLNMSTWKFLGQPCPTATIDGQPISLPPQATVGSV
jgi:hypothetical protein